METHHSDNPLLIPLETTIELYGYTIFLLLVHIANILHVRVFFYPIVRESKMFTLLPRTSLIY